MRLQKNFIKNILSGLMIGFLIFNMFEIEIKASNFFVSDEANILTKETEDYIINTNKEFSKTNEKPQIVVATIKTLNDSTIEEFANKYFEDKQIGNKEYDNGVLLILSLEERNIRIEVGYGLEGAITDSMAGRIIDSNIEKLKENDFDQGILGIFKQLTSQVVNEYQYGEWGDTDLPPTITSEEDNAIWQLIIVGIVGSAFLIWIIGLDGFLLLLLNIFSGTGNSNYSNNGYDSFGGGGSSGGGGASRDF